MDKYTEKIALYMEDMLAGKERIELEAHLAVCPVCQAEHAALKQIDQLLVNTPMAAPGPDFVAQVEMRLERRVNRRKTMAGMAIIGVVLLLGASFLAWSAASSGMTTLAWLSNANWLSASIDGLTALLVAGGVFFKMTTLVVSAMLQVVRHPAFWGYIALAVGVISLWTQLLRRATFAQQTI
ncbi:MAG TPA: hypothetical protein G4N96_03430 [Chloroflexi bacterium]|nr:hypothetical protein [Chloroflexota bacterium]